MVWLALNRLFFYKAICMKGYMHLSLSGFDVGFKSNFKCIYGEKNEKSSEINLIGSRAIV